MWGESNLRFVMSDLTNPRVQSIRETNGIFDISSVICKKNQFVAQMVNPDISRRKKGFYGVS